jgi:DNA-binding SARP family transcriptional activator/TolB-like protein
LLAYLGVRPGRGHGRDKLTGLLWDDQAEPQARANLRKAISRLRQALPEAARALRIDATTVAVVPDGLEVDTERFERLATEGTPASLELAAALYQGPFLEGFGGGGEQFEEWLMAERQRLDEALRQVLLRLLEHYGVTGAIERAIRVALRLLDLDPLQEAVHRTLMRLYLIQDRVGSALEQYGRCRDVLARELGTEPAPETEALRGEISSMRPRNSVARAERDALPRGAGAPDGPSHLRRSPTGRPSIAVLSFGADGDADVPRHLREGMAEDVATELGRFQEIDVIAPASALSYRESSVEPERAGVELGAAYVLVGNLRLVGGRLRTTVSLVETQTGRQRWAERYECESGDILDAQDDIVRRVVGSIAGRVEYVRLAAARRQRPEDSQAYELCLQGRSALKRLDHPALRDARDFFERAAAKDPHFARAYSGLALTLWAESTCVSWKHWVFVRRKTLELARRAVELDDRDNRAHCILGVAQLYSRDYEAARRQLIKALELNPNDADVLAHASFGLALIGDHAQAVEAGRRALRLQPHHPDWYAGFVGIALFSARLHEEAVGTMIPAPEAFCTEPAFIAAAYALLGQKAAAARYRPTVYRHYRNRLKRAAASPAATGCIDWLLDSDPFQLVSDVEHYTVGLRAAGFD